MSSSRYDNRPSNRLSPDETPEHRSEGANGSSSSDDLKRGDAARSAPDGAPQNGAPQNGASQNGASRNGNGEDRPSGDERFQNSRAEGKASTNGHQSTDPDRDRSRTRASREDGAPHEDESAPLPLSSASGRSDPADGHAFYADRPYAQFVGPWQEEEVETVYRAIQAAEEIYDREASPGESEVLVDNNPNRLRRRWLCVSYRLNVTQDYFAALRYDRERAILARGASALAESIASSQSPGS